MGQSQFNMLANRTILSTAGTIHSIDTERENPRKRKWSDPPEDGELWDEEPELPRAISPKPTPGERLPKGPRMGTNASIQNKIDEYAKRSIDIYPAYQAAASWNAQLVRNLLPDKAMCVLYPIYAVLDTSNEAI